MSIHARATILKNFSWSVFAELCFKALSFLFFIVFSRRLGQESLGIYTYLFSVLALANLFWDMGIGTYFNRKWVSEPNDFKKDVQLITGTHIVLVGISFLVLLPYLFIYERYLFISFILVTAIYFVDLFKSVPMLYFLSQNRFDKVYNINFPEKLFSYGGGVIVLFLGYSLQSVLVCFLIGKFIALVVGNIYKFSLFLPVFDKKKMFGLVKSGFSLFLISVFGTMYFRIDSVMIKYFQNYEVLGLYSAAYRLLDLSAVVSAIIGTSVFPILVSFQNSDQNRLSNLISKNVKYLSISSVFIILTLILSRREIIYFLYGDKFKISAHLLGFLAPTIFFMFLNTVFVNQLIANHQEKYLLKILIVLAFFNFLINLYLIPTYGPAGAAVSTLICELLSCIALYRQVKISFSMSWIIWIIVAAVISSVIYVFLKNYMYWMLAVGFSSMVYFVVLYFVKVVDLNDFKILRKN